MYINIKVEIEKSKLELETFRFRLLDHPTRLKLYEYLLSTRTSTRHDFRIKECWISGERKNTLNEVPLTKDIVEQARQQLVDMFADVSVGVE